MQESFFTLGVSARVVRVLERRGITAPFAVQQLVLPDALAGLDVLAASPTGSGKTLAFGIPLIERVDAARSCSFRRASSPRNGAATGSASTRWPPASSPLR